jgi:ABC-2 type transport system permease protein
VPFNGNLLLFIFLTIPFILTTLGTGLVVASGAKSQIEAMQLAILARIIPGQYLSGYIFPIESMPTFFQYVTYLFPERYLTEVSRGILLRGASIKHLWFQGLILWLMTFIMLSLAARLYRKRLS